MRHPKSLCIIKKESTPKKLFPYFYRGCLCQKSLQNRCPSRLKTRKDARHKKLLKEVVKLPSNEEYALRKAEEALKNAKNSGADRKTIGLLQAEVDKCKGIINTCREGQSRTFF
jgi:hypothetical protein